MRRLTTLALVLIVLAVLGYFSWLNRQTGSVSVYGTFTIQLQLWMVMAVFFVAGFLLAESRNLSKYPTRFLQMLQQGWQGWRLHRRLNALEAFEEACLRCAPDDARRALGRISGAPLSQAVLRRWPPCGRDGERARASTVAVPCRTRQRRIQYQA